MDKREARKSIANNKKAFHDYFVDDKYEAGIELFGTEVKSIRAGQVNLKDSWCDIKNGEIFVQGMHMKREIFLTAIRFVFAAFLCINARL